MKWIIDQLFEVLTSFLALVQHVGMMTRDESEHDDSHRIHITFRISKIFFLRQLLERHVGQRSLPNVSVFVAFVKDGETKVGELVPSVLD